MDGATYDVVDQELRRRYRRRKAREDEARHKKKVEPPWEEIRKLAEDSMQQVKEIRNLVNSFGSTLSKPTTAPPPSSKTTSSTFMGEELEIEEGNSKDVHIEIAKVHLELKKDDEVIQIPKVGLFMKDKRMQTDMPTFLNSMSSKWLDSTSFIQSCLPFTIEEEEGIQDPFKEEEACPKKSLISITDSRTNPFQGEEDDVTVVAHELASFFLQRFVFRAEHQLSFVKTVWRHLSILARSGCIKFRLKPMNTCWKDILSGYNFIEGCNRQFSLEDGRNWGSLQ